MQLNTSLNSIKLSSLLSSLLKKKARRFLSVDFGRAFVKIVHVDSEGQEFKLLNYDLKNIAQAQDKRHELSEFINNFLKVNSIADKEVYLTISDPDYVIIRNLTLPAIPKEEVLEAAKWELKDELPFNLDQARCDWRIVREYIDEEKAQKNEIMFIIVKAKIIDEYISLLKDCGLNPAWISSAPFNYAQIFKYSKAQLGISAILDIGHKDGTLCIYKNDKLIFLRRLIFCSDKLNQSLTATLVSDAGRMELSYEQAEHILQTFGIPQNETQALEENIPAMQILSLIRPLLEDLVKELKRSFDYFNSYFQEDKPSVLYLTGGGANLKNLDLHLQKELNINVNRLPIPDCVYRQNIMQERLNKDQNQIISALACALTEQDAINLLPEEIKAQKVEFIEKVSLKFVTITVAAIFLFSLLVFRLEMRDYKERLKNAKIHLKTISGIKDLKQKIDLQQELIDRIQEDKTPADGILKILSLLVPRDIVLQGLSLEDHRLILTGTVTAGEDVAETVLIEFMQKLEESSFFIEATLLASRKTASAQEFEIKCDLIH